jgi:membrane associated rhomboid family serine protease
MLPLKDNVPSRSTPIITWALIGVTAGVHLYQQTLSAGAERALVRAYGMTPASLGLIPSLAWLTLVTSVFLHGGWFHFLSNMWTLFIFGDNVEDRMGRGRYLVFYVLSGVIANVMQALVDPGSRIPAIGASGAIAGVLGAYFLLFPRARVVSLIPLVFYFWMAEIPAVIFLGFWFITQLVSGLSSLGMPEGMGGIAWWAHIGGFVFGLLTVRLFAIRQTLVARRSMDDYWPY